MPNEKTGALERRFLDNSLASTTLVKHKFPDSALDGGSNEWASLSEGEILRVVGAWKVGKVMDTVAAKRTDWYDGSIGGAHRLALNVNIEWLDWRKLRHMTGRADIGAAIPGASAGLDGINLERQLNWPTQFLVGRAAEDVVVARELNTPVRPVEFTHEKAEKQLRREQSELLAGFADRDAPESRGAIARRTTELLQLFHARDVTSYISRLKTERKIRRFNGTDAMTRGRPMARRALALQRLAEFRRVTADDGIARDSAAVEGVWAALARGKSTITVERIAEWIVDATTSEERAFFGIIGPADLRRYDPTDVAALVGQFFARIDVDDSEEITKTELARKRSRS